MKSPSVAIVCDWLISRGGAERVIATIAEMYPDAPIFTSIYNPDLFPEFKNRTVITSFIQKFPFATTKHYLYLPLMPYAFEQFDLSEFDIVISSSHSCAKGVITKPGTLHICYCHSPMRYAWDSCHEYFEQYGIPPLLKPRAKKMLHELRIWDRVAADRVDFFIANSNHVSHRIEKYYRRESEVIYPPVEVNRFSLRPKTEQPGQYFLAVGRLAPYKRFDLLIDAFNDLKLPLIIVGTGRQQNLLKRRAGRFITLLGGVSDEELGNLYRKARALIFPQEEDFGIIPLEAMSCGTPVIAFGQGGALETVVPGSTGLFFSEQTVESLQKSIIEFQAIRFLPQQIRQHAAEFDHSVFKSRLSAFVQTKWQLWLKQMRS